MRDLAKPSAFLLVVYAFTLVVQCFVPCSSCDEQARRTQTGSGISPDAILAELGWDAARRPQLTRCLDLVRRARPGFARTALCAEFGPADAERVLAVLGFRRSPQTRRGRHRDGLPCGHGSEETQEQQEGRLQEGHEEEARR